MHKKVLLSLSLLFTILLASRLDNLPNYDYTSTLPVFQKSQIEHSLKKENKEKKLLEEDETQEKKSAKVSKILEEEFEYLDDPFGSIEHQVRKNSDNRNDKLFTGKEKGVNVL